MNPLRLRLQNVGRFADLEIDLPEGLLAVVGSNGSGKSTLVGAIELALFAEGSRDLAGCLSPWADRLEIELTFEHNGQVFRVRRGYTGGARGKATLDFDYWKDAPLHSGDDTGPCWEALTRETATATQQLIVQTIGLSRRTFGASAFLGQGNAGAFPEATAADRKGMLGEILDPRGFWPHVASCAAAERRAAEASVVVDQARIADGETQLEALSELETQRFEGAEEVARADSAVITAERYVGEAQEALTAAQAGAERARTLAAEHQAALAAANRAGADVRDAEVAAALHESTSHELSGLAATTPVERLEAKVEEQRARTEARADALRRRDNAHRERNDLLARMAQVADQGVADKTRHANLTLQADELEQHRHDEHRCETCGQTLPDVARQKVIDGLRENALAALLKAQLALADVETLEIRAADMLTLIEAITIPDVPLDDYAAQLAHARKVEARRLELGVLIGGYAEKVARFDELRSVHKKAQETLRAAEERFDALVRTDAIDGLEDAVVYRSAQLVEARSALAAAQQRQARLLQQIETLIGVSQSVQKTRAQVAGALAQIDLLRLAERAFGRDGIPALIVESVIGVIEAETNRLLEMMPTSDGETFRVELRTQRALKTAEHLKETLDIVVSDRDGERAYETYSGGEQARLNICLRIALALLLADRRGAESRLLVVDELEYLDALGQEQLVDVVRSVGSRFDRTIVVSHHPGIRDAFDNTLRIVKDDGVSRVLSDGDGMMVA